MSAHKRFRAPLVAISGLMMAGVAFAGPAQAADGAYPPPAGTDVLGATVTAEVPATNPESGSLAFTGTNAIRIGGLGGLLLVGGGILVAAGRRRKTNA
jgi:hypothetical protein